MSEPSQVGNNVGQCRSNNRLVESPEEDSQQYSAECDDHLSS